jgi:hypothetical protein
LRLLKNITAFIFLLGHQMGGSNAKQGHNKWSTTDIKINHVQMVKP